jgi:hypothetical protein
MGRRATALIVVTLAATAVSAAMAAPPRPLRRLTGTVERAIHAQGPCRGGVRVTDEEMQEWQAKTQRFPIAKSTFTVFAGNRRVGKPVTRFKTDRAGRFEAQLPDGDFCVMAGELGRAEPASSPVAAAPQPYVDAECLRDRALACDAQLFVRGDSTRVKVTLDTFTPCPQQWAQPCYRGPMPP